MRKKIIEQEKSIQLDLICARPLIEEYPKAKQLELQLVEGAKLIYQYENAIRTYYNIYIAASGAVLIIWARFGFENIIVEVLVPLGMFVFSIFTALFIQRLRRPLNSLYATLPLVERELGLDLQEKFRRLNGKTRFKIWRTSSQIWMKRIVVIVGLLFLIMCYFVVSQNRKALSLETSRIQSAVLEDVESFKILLSLQPDRSSR